MIHTIMIDNGARQTNKKEMNHFEISGQKPEKSCKINVSYASGVSICIALGVHCV